MNILDIIIAKKKSFTGETQTLIRQAQAAMAQANTVAEKIEDAQTALENATAANEAAETVNTRAEAIAAELEEMREDISTAAASAANAAVTEVNASVAAAATAAQAKADAAVAEISVLDNNTSNTKGKKIRVTKGNNTSIDTPIVKNYSTTGQNEDGGMTQKAITDAINAISQSGGGSGSGNISSDITSADAGQIVVVGNDGNIQPSTISEDDLIRTQIVLGTYEAGDILGLEIDYVNKTFRRVQQAATKSAGSDFNSYAMYGGRKRCVVNDNGEILAFITPDMNNIPEGNIMVYQPAFYYMRVPIQTSSESGRGAQIEKEQLFISANPRSGFSLHPLFYDAQGNPVKFVLLSAYEGSAKRANGTNVLDDAQDINFSTDKLASVPNAKPMSGRTQDFTVAAARTLASNIGTGWSITSIEALSALQMLMSIEYGSLNLQNEFNRGICDITTVSGVNCSANTGATASLGNMTGQAAKTTFVINGNTSTYSDNGKSAISYRGVENPYGNTWQFIGNLTVQNDHYVHNGNTTYASTPRATGWNYTFNYVENMKWAFLPFNVGSNANSSVPIGDQTYIDLNIASKVIVAGGYATFKENLGLFVYGIDASINVHKHNYNARLLFTPTASSTIETANYNAWLATF